MAINELRSITTFIKAAELGSLRKAAQALGISPQAASKALAQLETHLNARLFHRTTRVMSLTDAGQRLLEDVQPALLGMQRALQNAQTARDEFAGPLRIAGPRTTFQPILWRLVEEFCELYPGIHPDVLLDDRPKVSPGVKFGDAELVGVPQIVIVGRGAADGEVELWDRRTGEREVVPAAEVVERLRAR